MVLEIPADLLPVRYELLVTVSLYYSFVEVCKYNCP
jgi:hypothetical protein